LSAQGGVKVKKNLLNAAIGLPPQTPTQNATITGYMDTRKQRDILKGSQQPQKGGYWNYNSTNIKDLNLDQLKEKMESPSKKS